MPAPRSGGFALVELLISIGILTLVLSAVMVRQSSFNSAVLLENQAFEVAFDIRQTQLQAISAQAGLDGDFYQSYRIDFREGDSVYDIFRVPTEDQATRIGAPQQLDRRFTIASIRDSGQSPEDSHNQISIQFTRPNFDAEFRNEVGDEIEEDAIQIFVCPTEDSDMRAARQIERMDRMIKNEIPEDARYDLNNDGNLNIEDLEIAFEIHNAADGICFFRMVEVTSTGQITVK